MHLQTFGRWEQTLFLEVIAPLKPPPEIRRKQDFRVGQRVSFAEQSLTRHIGEIARINRRTATVHCDGRAEPVAFAALMAVISDPVAGFNGLLTLPASRYVHDA